MLTSIGALFLFGFIANRSFEKIRIPGLLGILLTGVIMGPYVLKLFDKNLLLVASDIRNIAMILILLRAGLGINKKVLEKVGLTTLKISALPAIFEGVSVMFLAKWLFGFSFIEGGMLGFILAAVSPAVIVPEMLALKEKGLGQNKEIPSLIIAGASIDDVFAIALFTIFLGMGVSKNVNVLAEVLKIPVSLGGGILLGVVFGFILFLLFRQKRLKIRATEKTMLLIGAAILLTEIGDRLKLASLLGVMTIGFVLLEKLNDTSIKLSLKLSKAWVFAEIFLFALIGAEVNLGVAWQAGLAGLALIFLSMIGRSIGVILATVGSGLNWKEILFCVIAYTPKATVQAAIGAVPLAMGIKSGEVILAIAVLSIIITAPIGAFLIRFTAPWLLYKSQ